MPRTLQFGLYLMIVCLVTSCARATGEPTADEGRLTGKLVVTGSSTVAPVVAEIAAVFERMHPGVRIDVQSGGSGRGIADARSGVADIGMASRALAPDELDLMATQIAIDAITLIVHANNPVRALTREEVVGIFTGRVTDWSDLGGSKGRVTVIHKAAGRATRDVFLGYFRIAEQSAAASVVIGENEHGIKTVAGNPSAIGYVSMGAALLDAAAGVPVRTLSVLGEDSDAAAISRPLVLLTGGAPSPLALAFIEFACSDKAAPLIRAQHFIPTPH